MLLLDMSVRFCDSSVILVQNFFCDSIIDRQTNSIYLSEARSEIILERFVRHFDCVFVCLSQDGNTPLPIVMK